jgi:hypothetical protein
MKLNTLITNIQIKKCLIVFTALLLITNYIFIGTAAALSDEQRSLYNKGINYYDIDGGCTIDNSLPNTSNNNKVYIVGDSYSVGIDQVMTKDLNDANYKVIGRNEDNAGTITSNGGDGGNGGNAGDGGMGGTGGNGGNGCGEITPTVTITNSFITYLYRIAYAGSYGYGGGGGQSTAGTGGAGGWGYAPYSGSNGQPGYLGNQGSAGATGSDGTSGTNGTASNYSIVSGSITYIY